jgi:ATP-dependent Lhr-like helicase
MMPWIEMMGADNTFSPEVGGVFFGQFSGLRPMQVAAIESLCAGRNIVLSAGTGSGKTEAVVAPLISQYRSVALQEDCPVLLYVCPTKALINDLARRLEPPLERLSLSLAVRHGDRNDLRNGGTAHVILTTPESLGILITQNHESLKTIRAVVLDEVHLLYNNQRGLMTAVLLHRLRRSVGHLLQTAALSATVGRLEDIRKFILGDNAQADLLAFPGGRTIDGDIRTVRSEADAAALVGRLVKAPGRKLLVFVNSRGEAEALVARLKENPEMDGIVATHHSSLSPEGREVVESWFGSADRAVCVSTSTLEMGIDIGDIDAVVLYGPPSTVESLLQRIGRGNRRSNKTNVVCLSRDGADSIRETAIFSTMLGLAAEGRMPARAPLQLFGAVGQQCLAAVLGREGGYTRVQDLCDEVGFRPDLERPVIEEILEELGVQEFLQRHGYKNRFGAGEKLWDLAEKNLIWGNFPIAGQNVDLEVGGRLIGTIPRANLMRLVPGAVFRFGGSRYRVKGLVDQKLRVSPAPGKGGEVTLVFGNRGAEGLDAFVADSLWHWLFRATEESSFLTKAHWEPIEKVITELRGVAGLEDLPFSGTGATVRYFTFAGITVNRVILAWLGLPPGGADDLSIVLPTAVDWSKLPTAQSALLGAAESCFASSDRQTIFQQCLPLELQRKEWIEEWLKDDDTTSVLTRLAASRPVQVPLDLFSKLNS